MSDSQFVKTTVILPVTDLYDSIAWYERVLGFRSRYIHGSGRRGETEEFANYAIVARDAVEVHFILDETPDAGPRGWDRPGNGRLGLTVSNVDNVYAAVVAAGVPIVSALQKLNWPARGFDVKDPDGNAIHIEQPL